MNQTTKQWQDDDSDYEFIHIADNVFYPIYDVIAADIIAQTGSTGGNLLDIGCGGGHLGRAIMRRTSHKGWFLDINAKAIEYAKQRAQQDDLTDRCTFLCNDVHAIPLPDNSMDLIVSRGSYQFWDDLEKAISEIYRILAPGGVTFIGGGCGNQELLDIIREKMKVIMPNWEEQVYKQGKNDIKQRMQQVLYKLNYPHSYFDQEGKGRWVMIRKQSK